jgi:hypothetical protein
VGEYNTFNDSRTRALATSEFAGLGDSHEHRIASQAAVGSFARSWIWDLKAGSDLNPT